MREMCLDVSTSQQEPSQLLPILVNVNHIPAASSTWPAAVSQGAEAASLMSATTGALQCAPAIALLCQLQDEWGVGVNYAVLVHDTPCDKSNTMPRLRCCLR